MVGFSFLTQKFYFIFIIIICVMGGGEFVNETGFSSNSDCSLIYDLIPLTLILIGVQILISTLSKFTSLSCSPRVIRKFCEIRRGELSLSYKGVETSP